MATFFGYKRLTTVDDWRGLAGENKWVPRRSAYELAHAWQAAGGLPPQIRDALDQSEHEHLKGLDVDLCLVEKPVFLDTNRAPSMTDVMAYGRNAIGQRVVFAVEGKADEVFALRVCSWVRGDEPEANLSLPPRASRQRRLRFLARHLALDIGTESRLRYQLLHRTVSAVLEAQLHGAEAAVVLIHAFGREAPENWRDFSDFIQELGGAAPVNGKVSGPYATGENRDVPTYFLWWQQPAAFGRG